MGQLIPSVREGWLYSLNDENLIRTIEIGSVDWYKWLKENSSFRFEFPSGNFTARKENRSAGWYWYAYRRVQGRLRSVYLGKSEELTPGRLTTVAERLEHLDNPSSIHVNLPSQLDFSVKVASRPFETHLLSAEMPSPPLPIPATPLIGREQELKTITSLLHDAGVNLVNLTGPGGVGKTRLALEVAKLLSTDFPGRVYFVPLIQIHDSQQVLPLIAQTLGLIEEGTLSVTDRLKLFLQQHRVLLVIDNFEHVMAAALLLGDLLTSVPLLKLLVTSREVLHLAGEQNFTVAPLAFPPPEHFTELELIAQYPAVELFIQRARAVTPVALNPASIHAIAKICAHLEGLPLAIELAATSVKLLPPQALLPRLAHRFELLTEGRSDMPVRHQTLRATLEWSYDLLTPQEKSLFQRLSVFTTGCNLTAAEAICNFDKSITPFLKVATALIDKSLLQSVDQATQEPRLQLLETIREFGWECLAKSDELQTIQAVRADYFLTWVEQLEPELSGPQQYLHLEQLEQDYPNLRAAFSFFVDNKSWQKAVRLAGALGWFWFMRGQLIEGQHWSEQALALRQGAPENLSFPDNRKVLFAAALFNLYLRERNQALKWIEESLAISQAIGDLVGIVKASVVLIKLLLLKGEVKLAQARIEEILALVQGNSNPWLLALVLYLQGTIALVNGENPRAEMLFERGFTLFNEAGDIHLAHQMFLVFTNILLEPGGEAKAKTLLDEQLDNFDLEKSYQLTGWILYLHGEMALLNGQRDQARAFLEQSRRTFELKTDRHGLVRATSLLAQVALADEDFPSASQLATQTMQIARAIEDEEVIVFFLEKMAGIVADQGMLTLAARLWGAAARQREVARAEETLPEPQNSQSRLEALRSSLGEQLFEAAWTEGWILNFEQLLNFQDTLLEKLHPEISLTKTSVYAGLTPRELDVLRFLVEGLSNAQIADRLIIQTSTVKAYLNSLYRKLGVYSRTAAMRYVMDHPLP